MTTYTITREFSPCVVPQSYVDLQQAFFPYPDLDLQKHVKEHANQILTCLKPYSGCTRFHAKIRAIVINCQGSVDPNFRLNNPFALFYELFQQVVRFPTATEPVFQVIEHCVQNRADKVREVCSKGNINLNCCYVTVGKPAKNNYLILPILLYSCQKKLTDISATLLKHGANPRLRHFNMEKQTALFLACFACDDKSAQITTVLDAGAEADEMHSDTLTTPPSSLIEHAARHLDQPLTCFLAFNGAKITEETKKIMHDFNFTRHHDIQCSIDFKVQLIIRGYAGLKDDLTKTVWNRIPHPIIAIILEYFVPGKDGLERADWKAISTELCTTFKITL